MAVCSFQVHDDSGDDGGDDVGDDGGGEGGDDDVGVGGDDGGDGGGDGGGEDGELVMPVKLKKAPPPKFTERFLPRDKATERHFLLLSPFFEGSEETGHGHEDRVEHFTGCKSISKRNFSSAFSYLHVGMFLRLILPAPHFGTTKMSGSELLPFD